MKLESQVVSLDLAKRLKELGVKQESLFYWLWKKYDEGQDGHFELLNWFDDQKSPISAFTVAELGEMLPWLVEKDGELFFNELTKNGPRPAIGKVWEIEYTSPDGDGGADRALGDFTVSADTEADARAKMLIYLLENKLITL